MVRQHEVHLGDADIRAAVRKGISATMQQHSSKGECTAAWLPPACPPAVSQPACMRSVAARLLLPIQDYYCTSCNADQMDADQKLLRTRDLLLCIVQHMELCVMNNHSVLSAGEEADEGVLSSLPLLVSTAYQAACPLAPAAGHQTLLTS